MFITIYKLDTEDIKICKALTDAAEMHRQVQFLFNSARKDHNVLYRVDSGNLIVQSDIKPIGDGIFEKIAQYDMDVKLDDWNEGCQFRFRIRAVPRVSYDNKKHYITSMDGRINWVREQLEKRGMAVMALRESSSGVFKVSSKINKRTGGVVKINAWEYEGVMELLDKDDFISGYTQGIGPHKSYGCGMLLLCG